MFSFRKSNNSFSRLQQALEESEGSYFSGGRFNLVDAAFAPAFRYFDVFDRVRGIDPFAQAPKVRAWRGALAQRPSVRAAVGADYPALLQQFVIEREGVLGTRLAAAA